MNRDLPLGDPDVLAVPTPFLHAAQGWNTLQPETVTKTHSVRIIKTFRQAAQCTWHPAHT